MRGKSLSLALVSGLLAGVVFGQGAPILVEDFEECRVEEFPAGWKDFALVRMDCVVPSVTCAETVDPAGEATRALRIPPRRCVGQGIYVDLPAREQHTVSVDVRIEQFADSEGAARDGALGVAWAKASPCVNPVFWRTVGIAAVGHTWRFLDTYLPVDCESLKSGEVVPTGIPALEGVWYRVQMRFDVAQGLLEAVVADLTNGESWDPVSFPINRARAAGGFDALMIGDWEFSARERWNESVIDNIVVDAERRPEFLRGDCNDDGTVNISDVVCILNWLFLGGAAPGCIAVTNTNGDAGEDVSDATYLLNHLFLGGPALVAPFPDCGPGTLPTDAETCEVPPKRCQ